MMLDFVQSSFGNAFFAGFIAGALIASAVYLIRGIVALFQRIIK